MKTLNVGYVSVYHFEPEAGSAHRNVLFSHATGIAALTYKDVLQRWATVLQVNVFAYDARGHGESKLDAKTAYANGFKAINHALCYDLREIFNGLREHFTGSWSLAGHSLGGWLALYTANEVDVDHVVLLDVPLLPPSSAFLWATACLFGQRGFHPLSRPARRRKRMFRSRREALIAFKRNPFFRKWDENHIAHYIDANFETLEDATLKLRHDPEWEADLFESQPAMHTPLFLKMNPKKRKELKVDLLAGDDSRICSPRSIRYFHQFFPRMRWLVVPQGGHMFPFENTPGLLGALALAFPKPAPSVPCDVELEAV
ncbi:MAG: alpha/beta hydrolase [Betaproteobacteria bacterium]|nr:alpha/beta hydrolase [Betaproteobacteria bacterium]